MSKFSSSAEVCLNTTNTSSGMADQTTVEISHEFPDPEYCENVPPGVNAFPGTSELKEENRVVTESSSALHSGLNNPYSAFSTPAPKSGSFKTGHSGFPSTLTPVLKQLNIHNCPSPPTFVNGSELKAPSFSFGDTVINSQRVTGSNQSANITPTLSRRPLVDANTPVCWLVDECLPEITLLDVTCDTTQQLSKNDPDLPDGMPSTPASDGFTHTFDSPVPLNNRNSDVIQSKGVEPFCPQTNSLKRNPLCKKIGARTVSGTSSNHHQTSQHNHSSRDFHATQDHSQISEVSKGEMMAGNRMMADVPESIDAPLRWLDDRYFPEITLLEVTHNSDFSPKGETPPVEVKQDVPVCGSQNNLPPSAAGGEAEAEPGTQDKIHGDVSRTPDANFMDTTASLCEQPDKSVGNNTPKISLEVTQDISMASVLEDSRPPLESSEKSTAMVQTSVESTPGVHPINVTRDISSSSNMSVHCAASHTEHTQCNSSQNAVSEAPCDPAATSTNAKGLEVLTGQLSRTLSEQSPKPTGSVNSTFTIVPHADQTPSTHGDATAQTLGPQNRTQDLSPSNGISPKSQSHVNNQPTTEFKTSEVENATFEKLRKSTGSTVLMEDVATNVNIQNNTFTMKPPKNSGTIILSESSSSDSHHSALDKPSPPKICDSAKPPKQGCVGAVPSERTKTTVTHSESRTITVRQTASDPAVKAASAAAPFDTKDSSHLGLSVKEGFPDTSGHHSLDTLENKANTFNLDDTLDIKEDALLTSTPMVTCKMFNFSTEREEGKFTAAQKKLYGDGPSKAAPQVQAEVPSNIVCGRRTFLAHPAAKSMLPPLKTASQLLRYKLASAPPERPDPSASGLPVTRQRTQAAALRRTDPSQVPNVKPLPYNLRPTTTGLRQPTGLLNLRLTGVETGIQRAAQGLRPPPGRSNTAAPSSSDKLHGPRVTNPAKISQAKKHYLPKGEPLPVTKRKKMDPSLQSEALKTSCGASIKAITLKPPTAAPKVSQGKAHRVDAAATASTAGASSSCNTVSRDGTSKQPEATQKGCVRCAELQQQLNIKLEEIARLNEEIMKYKQAHGEC